MCSWVKTAWENVNPALIRKSFKCCGISVETNGTEDDEIFDYDGLMIDEDKENKEEKPEILMIDVIQIAKACCIKHESRIKGLSINILVRLFQIMIALFSENTMIQLLQ